MRLRDALSSPLLRERLERFASDLSRDPAISAALEAFDGPLLQGLARVLATHPGAARHLAHRPHLLEALTRSDAERFRRRAHELAGFAGAARDLEEALDDIRWLRHDETLFAACHDLGSVLPFECISSFLSIVAEACLRWALQTAEQQTASRASGLAIVAMGRSAGRELTYHSDLDLVFLYSDRSSRERSVRTAQRVIGYLSTMTRAGVAYAVDARLRPSGHQGALVSTFASFERYQLERAAVWEHLALMRSRAIAGNTEPCQQLLASIRRRLLADPEPAWREIDAMRSRIEQERAGNAAGAFKTGSGGLMDVEFLAAGALLECGPSDSLPSIPSLLRRHVTGPQLEALLRDYAFLRRFEARARWVAGRAIERFDLDRDDAPIVAELMQPGLRVDDLRADLDAVRARIRARYRAVIQAQTIQVLNRRERPHGVASDDTSEATPEDPWSGSR